MFAVPSNLQGEEEKEGGGAGDAHGSEAEEGSQTALNRESSIIIARVRHSRYDSFRFMQSTLLPFASS